MRGATGRWNRQCVYVPMGTCGLPDRNIIFTTPVGLFRNTPARPVTKKKGLPIDVRRRGRRRCVHERRCRAVN